MVARVRLLGVEEEIRSPGANEAFGAYMEFKFEVLEYLKGGYGLSPIWGYAYLEQAEGDTEEEARWKSKYFWQHRNSQWDDREAIVLMADIDIQNRKDHFGLGWFSPYRGESYRQIGKKKWLPAASESEVSGASDERTFLLDYPRSGIAGDLSDGVDLVSLAELRQLAALPYAKLHRRARGLKEDRYATTSPEDLPLATGIQRLSATSVLDRVNRSWVPIVKLYWDRADNADGVLGHRILRRKRSDADFTELADAPADGAPFYQDTQGIQPETNYIYHLRAYGENGDIADARIAITTVAALEPLDGAPASRRRFPRQRPVATQQASKRWLRPLLLQQTQKILINYTQSTIVEGDGLPIVEREAFTPPFLFIGIARLVYVQPILRHKVGRDSLRESHLTLCTLQFPQPHTIKPASMG